MVKKTHYVLITTLLILFSIVLAACGNAVDASNTSATTHNSNINCVSGNLQITGSTALQPLVKDVANAYQQKCSGANITVGGGGSSTGLNNAQNGSSQIGNSDVFADPAKYPNLVDHQVAIVPFTVVINQKVTNVDNLTSQQLQGIYSGKVTNWNQLGGPNLAIVPISRPAGSGTRLTFEEYVLHGKETISGNPVANASGEVSTTVKQTDGAVSYIALDFAAKNNLKVVKLDGIQDTPANVENNTYKFWNIEHMYTKGQASGLTQAFINYMTSPDTAIYRQQQGFLDITKMSKSAIAAKTSPGQR
jgi:phosphate transport system substrate-binding protein